MRVPDSRLAKPQATDELIQECYAARAALEKACGPIKKVKTGKKTEK